jgi:hypothetical protein
MTTPHPPPASHGGQGPLAQSLVDLAGMSDELSILDHQLVLITRLAVDRVAAIDYASVTALREDACTTVAASSDLALAVDEAQYADQAGPCLQPLDSGKPVGVPDIQATMLWPGFREQASAIGLRASLSVPLFGGDGKPIAVLNLYSHDHSAMAPVIEGVWNVFNHDSETATTADNGEAPSLEPGAAELIAGLAQAFDIRATIHRAVGVIMAQNGVSAFDAYLTLRSRAAATGSSLTATASAVIKQASA